MMPLRMAIFVKISELGNAVKVSEVKHGHCRDAVAMMTFATGLFLGLQPTVEIGICIYPYSNTKKMMKYVYHLETMYGRARSTST